MPSDPAPDFTFAASAFDPDQLAAARAAYAEPPRAYHDFHHVEEVLRHAADASGGPGWAQPREVALAILYHDAVYVAGRGDNEARSAAFATDEIARWMPDAGVDVARVVELIELTARHGQFAPDDFPRDARGDDTRHFLDCDMAILGAAPDAFDAYDRGIAAEYRGAVPAWVFKLNRRRFLKALLAKPRLYLSEFFHARLDAQARRNLRRAVNEKR
jgi:predicted metal-dependent HD superfamily phosphohydrolase